MAAHRYWKIYVYDTDRSNKYTGMAEVELRQTLGGADETGSGTASASSSTGSEVPSAAVDNNLATDWYSGGPVPQWWAYDFGAGVTKDIVEVAITGVTGYADAGPKQFELKYSDDGIAWFSLYVWNTTWPTVTQQVFQVPSPPVSPHVQSDKNYVVGNTTVSKAFPSSITPGNLIIIVVGAWNASGTPPTIITPTTNNGSPTVVLAKSTTGIKSGSSSSRLSTFYIFNAPAGATTITVTTGGSSDIDLIIAEYTGFPYFDVSNGAASGTDWPSQSSGPITTKGNDLVLGIGYNQTENIKLDTHVSSGFGLTERKQTQNSDGANALLSDVVLSSISIDYSISIDDNVHNSSMHAHIVAFSIVSTPLPPGLKIAGMPLVEITINGNLERVSMEGYALTHNWRPMVVDYGTIVGALPSDHGGYWKITFGTITFNPLLFKNPAYWPCPASCPISIYFADKVEEDKVLLFKGMAQLVSYDRTGIKFSLYGLAYDDAIPNPTTYTDTLNNVITSILTLIPEITSVNTSLARSPSPAVDYTVSNDNVLAIDTASQIAEFFSHLFYIDGTTAYLVDMTRYNGSMIFDEFHHLAYPVVSCKAPLAKVTAVNGTYSQISFFPWGSVLAITEYATDPTTITDALYNIINIENSPRVKIDIPMIGINRPNPGQKMLAYDTGTVQDEWVYFATRKMTFDFNNFKITAEGENLPYMTT